MDHTKFHSQMQEIIATYHQIHNQKSILYTKEKHNAFTLWTRDLLKYADWSSKCSPKKFIAIVQSRLDTRANTIEALGKKLQHFGLNRQPCLYYTEKTPRDKIDELEQRLVEFCRPEGKFENFQHKNSRKIPKLVFQFFENSIKMITIDAEISNGVAKTKIQVDIGK